MQVKDIYATGNGSLPKNSKLLGESKKKKAAEIAARAVESSAKNPLAGANNSGYNTSENTFDAIMQRLEESDKSPEMQEILGNANPSKSPEEVGAENWRGQINDTPPEYPEKIRPARQYEKNKDVDLSEVMDEQGHINGQGREPIASVPYGIARAGLSACESIAINNVLADYGKNPDFHDISRTAYEKNYLRMGGLLGMFPEDTERLMEDYGIQYRETTPEEVEQNVEYLMKLYGILNKPINPQILQKNADEEYMFDRERYVAVIQKNIKVGNSAIPNPIGGIHTFLMVYDKEGQEIGNTGEIGHWIVYNRFNPDTAPRVYKDLDAILEDNNRYLKIYEITGVEDSDEA